MNKNRDLGIHMNPIDLVTPFWTSSVMHGETLLFVRHKIESNPSARLAFRPTRIFSVTSASGEIQFELNRDYLWPSGRRELIIPKDSRIPALAESELYPRRGSQKFGTCRIREADILFAEGPEYHRLQVAVTYQYAPKNGAIPLVSAEASLPILARKLADQKPLSVVLLGDSISVGMNASGLYHMPPHQLGYGPLIASALHAQFGGPVTFTNLSVGGKNSKWGIAQVPDVIQAKPDLAILAFGMNDASGKVAPEQFASNIRQIMAETLKRCPETEWILVASMTGNPEWTGTSSEHYPLYRDSLLQLAVMGVAVADVTSIWTDLLARKKFYDLTGNGLNHPNDFGHRLYAQVIWSVLLKAIAPL